MNITSSIKWSEKSREHHCEPGKRNTIASNCESSKSSEFSAVHNVKSSQKRGKSLKRNLNKRISCHDCQHLWIVRVREKTANCELFGPEISNARTFSSWVPAEALIVDLERNSISHIPTGVFNHLTQCKPHYIAWKSNFFCWERCFQWDGITENPVLKFQHNSSHSWFSFQNSCWQDWQDLPRLCMKMTFLAWHLNFGPHQNHVKIVENHKLYVAKRCTN